MSRLALALALLPLLITALACGGGGGPANQLTHTGGHLGDLVLPLPQGSASDWDGVKDQASVELRYPTKEDAVFGVALCEDAGALETQIADLLEAGGFTFESAKGGALATEWYVRHPEREREVAKLTLTKAKCTLKVTAH